MNDVPRRIVIPGGSGHLGRFLAGKMAARGDDVVILTRRPDADLPRGVRAVTWDGRTEGRWTAEVDGCDVVLNLAGRSVSCRYNKVNLHEMMASRVESTRIVGAAIAAATTPPPVWLQMSTATIYAHRYDAANDEDTGIIGGGEPDAPGYWAYSVEIAKAWEAEQQAADTPDTRKVALRTAIAMSPGRGGAFEVMRMMARFGLGGPVAGGAQYFSWLHDADLLAAIDFLVVRDDIAGPVNLAAPNPLPHRDFMRALRAAIGMPIGLPATRRMAELGALVVGS
ncbi:MAG TPA: NAD-dependent epimerase/dehydratase family protein, partial [Pseudonocardiaceae bacterium]|nr:NAD-dependent epimerase/dehydratase family protein [Pseudonocardiaceae bacterium]